MNRQLHKELKNYIQQGIYSEGVVSAEGSMDVIEAVLIECLSEVRSLILESAMAEIAQLKETLAAQQKEEHEEELIACSPEECEEFDFKCEGTD